MKRTPSAFLLITSLVFLMALTSCNSSDKKGTAKNDKYEQAKETLKETEKKSPVRFLSVSGHDKKNLIGQTVIKGTLTSHAKEVSFKDVELELSFFSKTGALLEKDNETVYETLKPGESTNFKTKYFAPKGTDSVAIEVKGAKTE